MKDTIVNKTSGMRATSLDELSANYEYLGVLRRRQTDKRIINSGRGAWSIVAFKFQDMDGNGWGPEKMMVATFKNQSGVYTRYSYVIVHSKIEAQDVVDLVSEWFCLGAV